MNYSITFMTSLGPFGPRVTSKVHVFKIPSFKKRKKVKNNLLSPLNDKKTHFLHRKVKKIPYKSIKDKIPS